jgi:hypothetical protein
MQKLNETQQNKAAILKLDPNLKDTACQIRATVFHYLASNQLEDEIKFYMDNCRNSKQTHVVIEKSIMTLIGITENMRKDDFFQDCTMNLRTATVSHKKIKLLPCYLSTQMMLHYLKHTRGFLKINMSVEEQKRSIYYQFTPTNDRFMIVLQSHIPNNTPIIEIEMTGFDPLKNFDCYMQYFSNLDIAKVIMMLAASHKQFLKGTNVEAFNTSALNDANAFTIDELNLDLDNCNFNTYENFYRTARVHYNLHQDDQTHENKLFFIRHIRASEYKAPDLLNNLGIFAQHQINKLADSLLLEVNNGPI